MRTASAHTVSIVAALALGCAAPVGSIERAGDPASGDGKADRINPTDAENLGYLLVHGAPALTPGVVAYYGPEYPRVQLQYGNEILYLEQPLRVKAGLGCLQVADTGRDRLLTAAPLRTSRCDVAVRVGETTEITLSTIRATWDPEQLATDLGPIAYPVTLTTETNQTVIAANAPGRGYSSDPIHANTWVVAPGPFTVRYNADVLGPSTVIVGDGEDKVIDLAPASEARAFVHVAREPSSLASGVPVRAVACTNLNDVFVVSTRAPADADGDYAPSRYDALHRSVASDRGRASINDDRPWFSVAFTPGGNDQTVRMFPPKPGNYFVLTVNGTSTTLQSSPGATEEVFLPRIEVDSVAVDREDGSVIMIRADYTVDRAVASGFTPVRTRVWSGDSSCSGYAGLWPLKAWTPSSVLLMRDHYRVNLSYSTGEGPQTQTFLVDLTD